MSDKMGLLYLIQYNYIGIHDSVVLRAKGETKAKRLFFKKYPNYNLEKISIYEGNRPEKYLGLTQHEMDEQKKILGNLHKF